MYDRVTLCVGTWSLSNINGSKAKQKKMNNVCEKLYGSNVYFKPFDFVARLLLTPMNVRKSGHYCLA